MTEDGTGFEGVASSTRLDRHREQMTQRAMAKMASARGLRLLAEHGSAAHAVGKVERCWVEDGQLRVAGRLEPGEAGRRVYERLAHGEKLALSVGGRIKQAYWSWDGGRGAPIRCIEDVELDHVAICAPEAAVNPDTYLAVRSGEQLGKSAVTGKPGTAPAQGSDEAGRREVGDEQVLSRMVAALSGLGELIRGKRAAEDDGVESGEGGVPGAEAVAEPAADESVAEAEKPADPWGEVAGRLSQLEAAVETLNATLQTQQEAVTEASPEPAAAEGEMSKSEEAAEVVPGRPQSLHGQQGRRSKTEITWRGVV